MMSRLTLPVISRWTSTLSLTLRLDSAERLACALNVDLRTTRKPHAPHHPHRVLSFEEQLKRAVDPEKTRELARSSKIPFTRFQSWERYGNSKLLLREAFRLCTILELDLLVPLNVKEQSPCHET